MLTKMQTLRRASTEKSSPTRRSASPAHELDPISTVGIDGEKIVLEGSVVGQSFRIVGGDEDSDEQDADESE